METSRPHLFISTDAADYRRSVAQLRQAISDHPHVRALWQTLLAEVEAALDAPPLLPTTPLPGRDKGHVLHANRDYMIVAAAGGRVLSAALAALVTGEPRYRDVALRQMEALFDPGRWPEWRDLAHNEHPADLRTGQLALDLGLAYDWLHSQLNADQRRWIVEGLDRRAIQPYLQSVKRGASWAGADRRSNWQTVIVGGLGIAGMALGEDHPQSRQLVDFAVDRMSGYLSIYGPEGEFNESVSYAASTSRPVAFFLALQDHLGAQPAHAQSAPPLNLFPIFRSHCLWTMYQTLPPGRVAAYGDAGTESAPASYYFAAIAAAVRDPVLQWYYLSFPPDGHSQRCLPLELLWFDPTLTAQSPEGVHPHGRVFPAHGGLVSSRTDWNPRTTACVVYGKAGHGSEAHGHHDAGQVCIDGHGQRLIVDLGKPSLYPKDFFGPNRWRYYTASALGHNVLMFDRQDMRTGKEHRARYLDARFDEQLGATWAMDLSDLYDGVRAIRRRVVHLLPHIVAVLDEAELDDEREISLRWHTAQEPNLSADGAFALQAGDVGVSARIVFLGGDPVSFHSRRHAYEAPFDRDRLGELLHQPHEPYVEATLRGRSCRLLTLFAMFAPGQPNAPWTGAGGSWRIETAEGANLVTCTEDQLRVRYESSNREWLTALR